ncbi:hypothetical protein G7054_g2243 [Neopestalotiopsis clavispora]|nr:hypothetical protein G7054_g2243 [Neopestalotiopsis clavispora]
MRPVRCQGMRYFRTHGGADTEEVTFQDLIQKQGKDKKGYKKLLFCGEQAKRDDLDYFWVDTCCIDKANYTELSTALNSMFRWYQNAVHCYTYLSDVSTSSKDSWESQFRRSRWFERGWTLQELLAPASVKFYSVEQDFLGDKSEMVDVIHDITKIKAAALQGASLAQFPIHERMNWSRRRQTKEEEDIAYCLFGIFDVFVPLIYGEGEQHAMSRLEEAIEKRTGGSQGPGTPIPRQTFHLILPFGQNEDFVGREDILSRLVNRITPSARKFDCQRTVLEGLGGVGKTQIALEAAYRVHERDSRSSIFWVPAISMTSFENAYREIGRALGITGLDSGQTDVKTKIKLALEQSTTEWLLIIDNVDDISLLTQDGLQEYLPFHRNGSIFFTTRNHEVAVQLDVPPKHIYTIEEMSEDEALELLQNNLKPRQYQYCPEATRDLVRHLVYLPLAIKQASAYLSKTGETTEAYLKYCLASDDTQMELLNVEFEERWRYSKNTNPITTTWLISFQHLKQSYPLAVDYLQFICFLAEKDIPKSLLPPGDNEREKAKAIGILEGYAFISLREQSQSFDIHRLVRLVTRNWIKAEWEMHCSKAIQHMSLIYPWPQHENRQLWTSYLPHAQTILIEQNYCTDEVAVAELSYRVGRSYSQLGRYKDAEDMFRRSIELRTPFEDGQASVRKTLVSLGNSLRMQGKYQDAEDICRALLDSEEAVQEMGDNLLHNLANVVAEQGRYQEAGQLYQQALENDLSKLAPDNPSTLLTMNNMAKNLVHQGKLSEGEEIFRRTLEKRTSILGPEHPDTMAASIEMALVLSRQGKHDEAGEMFRDCFQRRIRVFGPEHPKTLNSAANVGHSLYKQVVLESQERYDEAEVMQREVFESRKLVLGSNHPKTLEAERNLQNLLNRGAETERQSGSEGSDEEESEEEDSDKEDSDEEGGVGL